MSVEEEWINSGVNIAWLSTEVDDDLIQVSSAVWDEMQAQPAWREWMTVYEDEIRGPFNYLAVEDREKRQVKRKRNGDLYVLVPVSELLIDDKAAAARKVLRDVLAERADMAGVPAPPE